MKSMLRLLLYVLIILSFSCTLFKKGSRTIIVAQDGSGDFTSIQSAIKSVPSNNTEPVTIFIKSGEYNERVNIPAMKPFITLRGEERENTIITAKVPHKSPRDSGVIRIDAHHTTLDSLTIKNTHPLGSGAEMAVRVFPVKNVLIKNCALYGKQDTVYFYGGASTGKIINSHIQGANDILSIEGKVYVKGTTFFTERPRSYAIWLYGKVLVENCIFDGAPSARVIRFASNKAIAYFIRNTYGVNVYRKPVDINRYKEGKIYYLESDPGIEFPSSAIKLHSESEINFSDL